MTIKYLIILFAASVGLCASHAQTKPKTTKEVMGRISNSFIRLLPYMNSEEKFEDPKSSGVIISNLTNIHNAFENAEHIMTFQTPGYQPSFETVKNHLSYTIDAFNTENKFFARTRLKSTAGLCISCHTQMEGGERGFVKVISAVGRGSFENDFDYAEFLFLMRDYVKSIRYFDRAIEERIEINKELEKVKRRVRTDDDNGYLDKSILQSLRRMLSIYTKIYYRPDKAIALLSKYEDKKGISKIIREDVKSWLAQLEVWNKRKLSYKLNNEKDLREFIEKYLDPIIKEGQSVADGSSDVTLLIASGFFYKFLSQRPSSEVAPEALYWLSIADRSLNFNFFYSLSDIYLKECITKYPKSEFAPKCYKEYEQNVIFGYSGSGGIDIPEEERKELERLKKFIKK